jgi:NAD(P)-dependent dehydrogenase (short-subunit alcohol dehydrogenase family)
MKKDILILGGSSSIAQELIKLHQDDIVYCSYHSVLDNSKNAFYLDLYDLKSYENIPVIEYDLVYSLLGYTPSLDLIEDIQTSKATIERNFLYPTLVLQYLINSKRVKKNGRIKVVTSVAGVRGRKLNYVYGASKSGLQTLIEGLANKYTNICFTDIVLGPVFTEAVPFHKTPKFLISQPAGVAKSIKRAISQVVFVPLKWRFLMYIIRSVPSFIYNRLKL